MGPAVMGLLAMVALAVNAGGGGVAGELCG